MPAALRYFRAAILIQIDVERNECVIKERIPVQPFPRPPSLAKPPWRNSTCIIP
jgi:hypothetical protein